MNTYQTITADPGDRFDDLTELLLSFHGPGRIAWFAGWALDIVGQCRKARPEDGAAFGEIEDAILQAFALSQSGDTEDNEDAALLLFRTALQFDRLRLRPFLDKAETALQGEFKAGQGRTTLEPDQQKYAARFLLQERQKCLEAGMSSKKAGRNTAWNEALQSTRQELQRKFNVTVSTKALKYYYNAHILPSIRAQMDNWDRFGDTHTPEAERAQREAWKRYYEALDAERAQLDSLDTPDQSV